MEYLKTIRYNISKYKRVEVIRMKTLNKKGSIGNKKLYLSVKEAAAYSGLSEYYIRKLISDKAIPYIETGKKFLINRIALKEYLNGQER